MSSPSAAAGLLQALAARSTTSRPRSRAARQELALSLADVMVRRTRLAQELPDRVRSIAPRVAEILGAELGWRRAGGRPARWRPGSRVGRARPGWNLRTSPQGRRGARSRRGSRRPTGPSEAGSRWAPDRRFSADAGVRRGALATLLATVKSSGR